VSALPEPNGVARVRATVEYDGTAFHGSQLQPAVRTVQSELEAALTRLLDRPTRVDFAGRTDAGVHAVGQEIAFHVPEGRVGPDLTRGIAALAPDDIAVAEPRPVDPDFHPRFDAERRRYEYLVAPGDVGRTPFLRNRAWRPGPEGGYELDGGAGRLGALAARIPGERDFSGLAKAGQPERGVRCAVETATWREDERGRLRFEIVADRFLHHMVRYLVGTLVEIAADRRPEADLDRLLAAEPPSRPVFPAPPAGLYLSGVRYADGWNREAGLPL